VAGAAVGSGTQGGCTTLSLLRSPREGAAALPLSSPPKSPKKINTSYRELLLTSPGPLPSLSSWGGAQVPNAQSLDIGQMARPVEREAEDTQAVSTLARMAPHLWNNGATTQVLTSVPALGLLGLKGHLGVPGPLLQSHRARCR
jgi:hypothetical protein